MPKLANTYLIFDFFITNADYRLTRLKAFWADAEKKGAVESEHRAKLVNFSIYYIQRRLTFDYIARKFIIRDAFFKKNAAVTLKIISLALGMCYFQSNSEGVLNELKILLRQYQNGAVASNLVVAVNNYLEKSSFAVPEIRHKDEADELSLRYSCPRELVAHLIGETGAGAAAVILENSLKPPPATFRLNTAILRSRQLRDDFIARFSEKYMLDVKKVYRDLPFYSCDRSSFNLTLTDLHEFRAGLITPMGRSAYLAAFLLGAETDELILDACAAPGNKATHIAELSSSAARVIAVDNSEERVAKISDNIDRLKLTNIFTMRADSTFLDAAKLNEKFGSIEPRDGVFDRVLLDAPCSGLGLMRGRIELKYRFAPRDLTSMPAVQRPLLRNAAKLLKRGGHLLYATCTINKKENAGLVREFIGETPGGFSLVPLRDKLEAFGHDFNVLDGDYETLQILPDEDGCEGFFYALMRKN